MSISEHIGEIAIGCAVALMGWFGKREIARLDELDKRKAEKSEIAEVLKRLDAHLEDDKDLRRELTERLEQVAEATVKTALTVARIEGQLTSRQ